MRSLRLIMLISATVLMFASCEKDSLLDSTVEVSLESQHQLEVGDVEQEIASAKAPNPAQVSYNGTMLLDYQCEWPRSWINVNWSAQTEQECYCILLDKIYEAADEGWCYDVTYDENLCKKGTTDNYDYCSF